MRKYGLIIVLVGVVALAGAGFYFGRKPYTFAQMAVAYGAQETCSCLHVSGRTLDACVADLPQESRGQVTITPEGDSVHASVLFGAVHAESVYEDGYGCRLQS